MLGECNEAWHATDVGPVRDPESVRLLLCGGHTRLRRDLIVTPDAITDYSEMVVVKGRLAR